MAAYNLIATTTVGVAGASGITFSNIPQTYTDLLLKVSLRSITSGTYDAFGVYLNGVQSDRTRRALFGNGSTVSSNTSTYRDLGVINGNTSTANTFSNIELYFPNYTSANFKSISSDSVWETNGTASDIAMFAGLWSSTAPITSILLDNASSGLSYMQHSSASLYGIKSS